MALITNGRTMRRYSIINNRMPIRLRFAFFKFYMRNVFFTWYANRKGGVMRRLPHLG